MLTEEAVKLLVKLRWAVAALLDSQPVKLLVYPADHGSTVLYEIHWRHRGFENGIVGNDPVELLKEALALVERS